MKQYLCSDRVLKNEDDACLAEEVVPVKTKGEKGERPRKAMDSETKDEL